MSKDNSKSNAKGRIIKGSLVLVALAGGFFVWQYLQTPVNSGQFDAGGDVSLPVESEKVVSVPGTSTDEKYNELQREVNQKNYEQASEEGTSFVATPVSDGVKVDLSELRVPEKPPVIEKKEVVEEYIPEPEPIVEVAPPPAIEPEPIVQLPPAQYKVVKPEPEKPALDDYKLELYQQEIGSLMSAWEAEKIGGMQDKLVKYSENDYLGVEVKEEPQSLATNDTSTTNGKVASSPAMFVRVGTKVPAEMDTSVNTDETTVVRAFITHGPLKGAVVLGNITRAPTTPNSRLQTVDFHFHTITKNGWKQAYQINAIAVNPETGNQGLATEVDNHNFRRYGLSFLAHFVAGVGDAFGNSNTTVITSPNGATTVANNGMNTNQIVKSGLGRAGNRLAGEIDNASNVPATIYVDSGTAFELLFLSDF